MNNNDDFGKVLYGLKLGARIATRIFEKIFTPAMAKHQPQICHS